MSGARNTRPRRALVGIVIGALVWTMLATVALAADKTFSATVSSPLVAGASYGEGARSTTLIGLTLKNESNQASLGSANVTAPTGVVLTNAVAATSSVGTATVVGGVLQLRNLGLAPGASANITFPGRVECASNNSPYIWTFDVRQRNDFNGVGNELTQINGPTTNSVSGNCGIVFSKQPKSAENDPTAITNAIYNPAGDAVTVTVKDGAGLDTVRWWSGSVSLAIGDDPTSGQAALGGTTSGSATNGDVTFAPTISLAASGYSLTATAAPNAGASAGTSTAAIESDNFNIVDDADICLTPNGKCKAQSQGPKTNASVEASGGGAAGDLVILSINDPTVTVDCAGYTETSDVIAYNVTASDGTTASNRPKLATFTLLAAFVTQSASKYEMCYTSTTPFKNNAGVLVTTGLLPSCVNKTTAPAPCVVSKALDKAKNLVLVVSSPAGDPGGKF